MQSISLNTLIKRSYLKSVLIPIIVVQSALVAMYFTVVFFITESQMSLTLAQATENLKTITQQQAGQLDLNIDEIARNAALMQQQIEYLYQHPIKSTFKSDNSGYQYHSNGALYRVNPMAESSLYYSNLHGLDASNIRKAHWSEQIDPILKAITEISPIVAQSYYNSWDSMIRIYPPVENMPDLFGPNMDIRKQPFYYMADNKHNPGRKAVLSNTYSDPLGMGWIVTAMAPVYNGDKLEGVAGIDLSISALANQVIDPNLPWRASSLLLDKHGNILAMDPDFNATLRVDVIAGQTFPDLVTQDVQRKDEFNVLSFNEERIKQFFAHFINSEHMQQNLIIDDRDYLVLRATVESTDWQVIAMVDKADLYRDAFTIKTQTLRIGFIAIAALLLFYILFFYLAKHRSKRFAKKIARPIHSLSKLTSNIETQHDFQTDDTGIQEIDQLQDNFGIMLRQLHQRQQHLIESKLDSRIQLERANLMKELSETDSLTGLSNRRKLDDILASEIGRSNRYHSPLSVILADIDHFKRVNDEHGHLKGDEIICRVGDLLKQHTRETDTIGRWGGEEFLLVCPGIDQVEAVGLAEKIRELLEATQQGDGIQVTASFGVAALQDNDTVDSLVSRADRGLYKSKQSGRNRVSE
ncbi:diguanylate cyclase domain-containing protein [Bermanella sp. R86510]|uniref:sensor domain-containing diguanylate cyclase n=1 Tax=unclassified Bermanella TaxID=2627862 RepID=UPI0037C98EFD